MEEIAARTIKNIQAAYQDTTADLRDTYNYHMGYIRGLLEAGRLSSTEYYTVRQYTIDNYNTMIRKGDRTNGRTQELDR